MDLAPRIVADPETCSGHARIAGTRIRVANVLAWLAAGMSEEEILQDYEQLTADDIRACLAYAAGSLDAPEAAA
jgi:uncharacterized protein (DUF433 family)